MMPLVKYPKIQLIYDDREKKPWDASFFGSEFKLTKKRLKIGDYTIKGHQKNIIVERKSSFKELAQNLSMRARRTYSRTP